MLDAAILQRTKEQGPVMCSHLPHEQVDIGLKDIVELLQGFMIAFGSLLLLLLQQVDQNLVLQALYENTPLPSS